MGDDREENAGTIHSSNQEDLLFLNALRGEIRKGTQGQLKSGSTRRTIHMSNPFLRQYAMTIRNRTRGQSIHPTNQTKPNQTKPNHTKAEHESIHLSNPEHLPHHAFLASHFEVYRYQLFDSHTVQGFSDQGT